MPLLPAGEYSSLWKSGKLWVIEDDTRTHLCPSDQVYGGWPLKWCHSLSDTTSILRKPHDCCWHLGCILSIWVTFFSRQQRYCC